MVWSGYVAVAHETGIITPPLTPSPKNRSPVKKDPRRRIDTDDAIDLYEYLNQVRNDTFCDTVLLNRPGYNSFHLEDLCNYRQIEFEMDELYPHWDNEYHRELDLMWERLNLSLSLMGKKIKINKKIFRRFVYVNSTGYLMYN